MYKFSNSKFNFKDLDLAFIDTETTGRSFEHELMEIAVVRVNSFNFVVLDEWSTKIKFYHPELADPDSLKIAHYNPEDWRQAMDLNDAMKIFLEKTEGAILVAHNLPFDWYYIHKALKECRLEPTFWFKGLDTISLAWCKLRHDPRIKNLSFRELTQYFNIQQEKPHSALDDAKTAYRLFFQLFVRDNNDKKVN
jgi:DNA polymerase III alpha subunit (gram-positive type)